MSDVVSVSSEVGRASDGFETLANLNDGFLGTGYSSTVELSYITMVLIVGYIAISMIRYFMPEARFFSFIAQALGFQDR